MAVDDLGRRDACITKSGAQVMMARRKERLGRLELDVLRYVADHHPISVREVAAHFAAASGQARTTVLTVMQRLRGKAVSRAVEGRWGAALLVDAR